MSSPSEDPSYSRAQWARGALDVAGFPVDCRRPYRTATPAASTDAAEAHRRHRAATDAAVAATAAKFGITPGITPRSTP